MAETPGSSIERILEVRDLRTAFAVDGGDLVAVDGVSFDVYRGKTLCIVGESGCGKSVTSLSIMRLVAKPAGRIVSGSIHYRGRDLLALSEPEMRLLRGKEISMIFQEPMTSLNPVFTIGNQLMEAIRLHQNLDRRSVRDRAIEMLRLVGMPAPEKRLEDYPHQLSGGMRQRVMIAMALSCDPKILIADEPTTALDVTIQAQILDLLKRLQRENGLGLVLITHDLGVVAEMADEVAVMYAGKVVERAPVETIFSAPRMPYTQALLKSVPVLGSKERLVPIPGMVPDLRRLPRGCRFQDRCEFVSDECRLTEPKLRELRSTGDGCFPHEVRCVRVVE